MVNSGLLIFCEVAESQNSGKSKKSREVYKTHKIPQNSPVILSNTYLHTTHFETLLASLLAVNLQIYLETLSLTQANNVPSQLPGVDYVAKNCMALAMMLKALPFNFAIGSFLECIVVERAKYDDPC